MAKLNTVNEFRAIKKYFLFNIGYFTTETFAVIRLMVIANKY